MNPETPARFEPLEDPEGIPSIQGFARGVKRLKDAVDEGDLDASAAQSISARQVLLDTSGTVWNVGLRSGRWYCFDDGRWHKQRHPPDPDLIVRPERTRKGCHACGAKVEGDEACPSCGAEPSPVLEDQPDEVRQGLLTFLQQAEYPMVPEPLPVDEPSVEPPA